VYKMNTYLVSCPVIFFNKSLQMVVLFVRLLKLRLIKNVFVSIFVVVQRDQFV
jgi:hypothetical protein